jgi:hypothetical protein
MKKLLYILLILPFFMNGQGWEKTFSGSNLEIDYSAQQTTDGGYIIAGTIGFSSWDLYLIKTDANGIEQWNRTYGGPYIDWDCSVQQTSDGGYIICGITNSFGNGDFDIWLIKTNSSGDSLWSKTFGGADHDLGYSVQQTTDGGYIIVGNTESYGNGDTDVWLIKTDSSGDSIWSKTFGGADDDLGYSVQQTIDGGYIITGSTWSFSNGDNNLYIIKTDDNGDSLWTKTFGEQYEDLGYSIQQTTDAGYIVAGITVSSFIGGHDLYIIKTDENGDSLWTKTFGGADYDLGYSVQQTIDGGYIIAGSTESYGNGGFDVWLIKTDSSGDSLWTKTFGGAHNDKGYSVQQTIDGGYIICGSTNSFKIGYIYLIKTDGNGNITSTFNIPTPNPNRKIESIVDILGRETKPKSNTPFIEIYDDGSVEKKLILE